MNGDASMSLWNWATEVYHIPAVRQSLLGLQDDYGLNVNLILWSLWRGAHFGDVGEAELRAAMTLASEWTNAITFHIRQARRAAAPSAAHTPAAGLDRDSLYQLLKASELESEKIELSRLSALTQEFFRREVSPGGAGARAARRALAAYVRLTEAPSHPEFSVAKLADLLETLAQHRMIGPMEQETPDAAA